MGIAALGWSLYEPISAIFVALGLSSLLGLWLRGTVRTPTVNEGPRDESDELATLRTEAARRGELLGSTVHELRTPLTTIKASLDILSSGLAEDPEEIQTFVSQAALAASHMVFLINDLLDSQAVDDGRLRVDLEPCPVNDIVGQMVAIMEPLAAVRAIGLHVTYAPDNPLVQTDRPRLLQVLFNLVGNAIKYSEENTVIEVAIEDTPLGAVIQIGDHGIGVPMEARKQLFTKYTRVHDRKASTATGTGIGLWLAKTLMERMRGTIGYEDRTDGTGSIFWITLPLAAPRDGVPVPAVQTDEGSGRPPLSS